MSIDNRVITEDSPRRFVTTLQRQLVRENPSALPLHGIDGEYGPETEDWVRRFQERKGLTVDGIAGPETLGSLREDIIYRPGDSGNGVQLLQEDLMYFTVDLSPYGADGDYGGITEQGVKDFQFFNSLVVDGVAGPDTFYKIDELYETILIQQGDEGAHVRRIQTQLNEQEEVELSISVDGIYGSETVGAIEEFQEATEQVVDGIAGPITMNLLDLTTIILETTEIESFLQSQGYNFSVDEVRDTETVNQYVELLESNVVFQNNVSGNHINTDVLGLVLIESNVFSSGESYFLQSELSNNSNLKILASFNGTNMDSLILGEIEGEGYESIVDIKTFDTDGNEVNAVEDTVLNLANADVELQLGLYEYANSVMLKNDGAADPCTWVGGAFGTLACSASLAATGIQPWLGTAVGFVCTTGLGAEVTEACNN